MSSAIPIFKSHYSFRGRSILTFDEAVEINPAKSISILSIAKKFNLENITIIDDSPAGLIELIRNWKKIDCGLRFGTNFIVCDSAAEQNEDSQFQEHKVSILFKNDRGYRDWCRIWNNYAPIKETFYYYPRIPLKKIVDNWTDNLLMILPPFDNFIHKNLLCSGRIIPDFGGIKPVLSFFESKVPWNFLINNKIQEYAAANGLDLINVHPIYYYQKADFETWQAIKALDDRGSFDKPDLEWCVSNEFCFEEFCLRSGLAKKDWEIER